MTFQTNSARNHQSNNGQEGVTLLLSVLVLSAITAISFSLAAVAFVEIANSNDLAKTEPVLYASIGIAEEATYGIKRGVTSLQTSLGTCNTFASYPNTPAQYVTNKTKICDINLDNDIEIDVPTNASSYNTARKLYAYDPANSGNGAGGYTQITIKNTSALQTSFGVYICELNQECESPGSGTYTWSHQKLPLLSGETDTYAAADGMSASKAYEINIINLGANAGFVEVITQPKGLPYLSKKAVEVQSSSGRLIRRLRVLIPTQ